MCLPLAFTMQFCGLVLLTWFLPGYARRNFRIDDSRHDAQQQDNMLIEALEVTAGVREALLPEGFGKAFNPGWGHVQPGSMRFGGPGAWRRFGKRRATVALHAASGQEEDLAALSRRELQALAKAQGVRANQKSAEIIAELEAVNHRGARGAVAAAGVGISKTSFLNQEQATQVDVDLMSVEGGFSIDQLMELAGLSVAAAIAKEYPPENYSKVLLLCGPGNNGGDGLVAARHLHHFGYKPSVVYPKMEEITAKNDLYKRLTVQLRQLSIPLTEEWAPPRKDDVDVIVDAVFGFSFKGWRGGGKDFPFDAMVDFLAAVEGDARSLVPVVSVDIPSGWDVDLGPPGGKAIRPEMLVSLTAPKLCALKFRGRFHYLGGRFVPPSIVTKNGLDLPSYPGAEQCVKLGKF